MITPNFKIEQDNKYIIIYVTLKYVKFSDYDYFIENNNFRFSLKPYFLNLTFSHNLKGDSDEHSFTYDIEKQLLTCKLLKLNEGEFFENLDLLSTVLTQNNNRNKNINKIEEINDNNNKICEIPAKNAQELNDYLFTLFTNINNKNDSNLLMNTDDYKYGFNNEFNDVFNKRSEEAIEIADINPKKVPNKLRWATKCEKEIYDFIPERFEEDQDLENIEDDYIRETYNSMISISNENFIKKIKKQENGMLYDNKEIEVLKQINKTKLSFLESEYFNPFKFYLQIIDIFFAYLYDLITTEYEHSSESGWTINKLSSTLSCFIDYDKNFYENNNEISFNIFDELIKNTLIGNYRRVLIYPLYRNIKLCEKVKKDLCFILKLGKYSILKCFLDIRNIFEKNDPRYLLNLIYIDPFIKFIQFNSDENIFKLIADKIENTIITLNDLKLDIKLNNS